MSNSSSQPGPLAFGEFLDHLRRQGFTIGVDHHLRLQQLLTGLAGQCAPQDLKTLLCPIFATNEKEQAIFYRAFDSYFELFQIAAEPEPKQPGIPKDDPQKPTARKSKWRSPLTVTLLSVLLISLAALVARNAGLFERTAQPVTPTPTSTASQASPAVSPTPQPTIIEFKPSPTAPAPTPSFWVRHREAIRLAAILVPLLCFLTLEWIRYRRRKLILDRARLRKPPHTWPIIVPATEIKDHRSEQFYKAVRGLRRRQVAKFHRLDVPRTIAATIAARGYPSFQYRPDSRVPEYIALIDRASWRDHQAAFFDSLAQAMEKEGLFVRRYFYEADPRICSPASLTEGEASRAVHLSDLRKKYPEHRLLVFGNGEKLIDPVSGELASWTAALFEWTDRALLTPAAHWGLREKKLAEHFILLPATLEDLGELAQRFDLPDRAEFELPEPDAEPPLNVEEPITVEALRDYLGEEAFQWLCACAVYPELHWELTLYFGSLPCMAPELINERNLFRLIRLPWFRTGSMPDQLRLQLIAEIQPVRERAIRSAIIELLEKNPAKEGSFAADARRLEIAVQRGWLSRGVPKEFRRAAAEIASFPPSDVARDYALVRVLESAPKSRLAMILPRGLKKLFYERGIPSFGLRTGARAVATVVVIAALFAGLSRLTPPPPLPQPNVNVTELDFKIEMVELPGGVFMMGSPVNETGHSDEEGPQHQVFVSPFAIGKYEVTQAQWRVVAALPKLALYLKPDPSSFKGDTLPVESVSWEEANEFCQRLSNETGLTFRLPTEAEWEYAARSGSTTKYSFGEADNLLSDYAWYYKNSNYETHPVGQKKPNGWGLYDMHGNVWEWCQDWYNENYYKQRERVDPQGPPSGMFRVLRGGWWGDRITSLRSSYRVRGVPDYQGRYVGLRIVMAAPKENAVLLPAANKTLTNLTPEPDSGSGQSFAPPSVDVLTGEGIKLAQRGRFTDAIKKYDEALKLDPKNPLALNLRAYSLFKAGKLEEAISTLHFEVKSNPDYTYGYFDLARMLCAKKDFEAATAAIRTALERDPSLKATMKGDGEFTRLCKQVLPIFELVPGSGR